MQNDWKVLKNFRIDLQVILTMLRYRDSKEELTDYINENKKFFQNVDYENVVRQ